MEKHFDLYESDSEKVTKILKALIIFGILGIIVFYLWNWLMPFLFSLPQINLLQSYGILILSNLLLKK